MQRLPMAAETRDEVFQYYVTRSKQMAQDGVTWSGELFAVDDYAFRTFFTRDQTRFQSVYILNRFRGQGKLRKLLNSDTPFITVRDCGVIDIFKRFNVSYYEVKGVLNSPEYLAIQTEYGDQRADRSQVFLMNHIDEGLSILNQIAASEAARRAYCLHPLLQNDRDLAKNYQYVADTMPAYHVMLAMEYRSVANEYLSEDVDLRVNPKNFGHIRLSPIKDVNDMLIADKVQNCKDFEIYHLGTHPRTEYLERYFDQWLRRLGVRDRYPEFVALLRI